ncbi:Rieske (2Fe-2S) protein [Streptomyces sp. SudanB25_2051]|uniref:Rieske (2Fe-2S) protein n=1 Tax=Streptomyces sp. SudanB25_2051 TaxID=3035275 RepID=UPI003F57FD6A
MQQLPPGSSGPVPRRRTVLTGALTAAAAAALTSACGDDAGDGAGGDPTPGGTARRTPGETAEPTAGGTAPPTPGETAEPTAGGRLIASTSDIPVGGGRVFAAEKVVVTQPAEGEFKAFSAVCTHQGCTVGSVANGLINCPCHASRFRIADASVASGPATRPLPERRISVSDGSVRLL